MASPAPQAPSALIAPSAQDDHSLAETVAEKTGSPLGERLAAYRKLNALSLEEVSTRAGITKSYLSKLERGLSSPTIATLIKLANALGITSEQLINANGAGSEIM
ncbi:MAG: XRE family transcriptional regulator, partial [Alcaligenaceae bacterium]